MATTTKTPEADPKPADAQALASQFQAFNQQMLEYGRSGSAAYLEGQEATLKSIAEQQEEFAKSVQVDWISEVARAQAKFTRDLAAVYARAGRDLRK